MLYTLIVLCSGIYLNQEYPDYFPSIRIIMSNVLLYLRTLRDTETQETQLTYYEQLKKNLMSFFK